MIEVVLDLLWQFWAVLCQMAPYLLFGFLMAGLLSVLVSPRLVEKHLGGRGLLQVLKATLLGIPLPLCSCGVIPVSASLRRHGASKAATTSFLLATPETGVDSILVTYSLMGGVVALFRPLAALAGGLLAGTAVHLLDRGDEPVPSAVADEERRQQQREAKLNGGGACAGARSPAEPRPRHWLYRLAHYGFVVLPEDIGKSLLVGLLIAGVLGVAIPNDFFARYEGLQSGIGAMLLMMAIGIPLYVCASASVPMAAMLWLKGMAPGAVLVFLITGPATNAATIAMIYKVMGRRTAAIYLSSVVVTALSAGFLLDAVLGIVGMPSIEHHMHHMLAAPPWWHQAAGVMLLGVLGYGLIVPHLPGKRKEDTWSAAMEETVVLTIKGMTCSHCAAAVQRALRESPGVQAVRVELSEGKAYVTGKDVKPPQLAQAVESLGYAAAQEK